MECESIGDMINSCQIKVREAGCPQDKDTQLQNGILCKWDEK